MYSYSRAVLKCFACFSICWLLLSMYSSSWSKYLSCIVFLYYEMYVDGFVPRSAYHCVRGSSCCWQLTVYIVSHAVHSFSHPYVS